ncbi:MULTISPECIES: transporter substrate-binding domain-containing protein [Salinicoccus]|uniref:Transporter substrate-binding domain-containing protein n=1 Tax=Salinicoccus siamensis TaxID=381830 RepID=A0ABV5Z7J0_9STAP|nr:transporter substrate-binding domain-containing protein [Salinicoccus roseus]RPE52866.1 amino acid ABC transporter substrate-binding protein (PAAT family) [Salinicoccus roseus]GGA72790.1 amino acid ABC transporter substrate-binding protein [Salinicoccus roseus]
MKRLLLSISFAAVLLVLAACGGEEESAEGAEESGEVRTVEVAVSSSSRPLSYVGDDGELTGYEPELLRAIDEKLEGYEFNMEGASDSAGEIGLDTGQYDMLAQGLILSPEREESYLVPDESNGPSLMKIFATGDQEGEIESLDDLQGKNVVPVTPTGGVFNLLNGYNEEHPDNQIEFDTSDGGIPTSDRLQEVNDGVYDALVHPSNLGQQEIIEEAGLDIHVTEPVEINPTYFLIHDSEENTELRDKVSEALAELKEEGTVSELSNEFYGEDILQYEE